MFDKIRFFVDPQGPERHVWTAGSLNQKTRKITNNGRGSVMSIVEAEAGSMPSTPRVKLFPRVGETAGTSSHDIGTVRNRAVDKSS